MVIMMKYTARVRRAITPITRPTRPVTSAASSQISQALVTPWKLAMAVTYAPSPKNTA